MFRIKFYPICEMDGDIGGSPSVEGAEEPASAEIASVQETPIEEVPTESESSFAKRLREHSEKTVRAEREKWEKETNEKYKDFDLLKTTADFFRERHGFQDLLSMKEEIELTRLQDRAEREQVSPETLRRIDELEAKAAKADQLEQQQQEEQRVGEFRSTLESFVKEKGVSAEELNQFMIDNELSYNPADMTKSFNIALKAMKAEQFEQQLATAKETAIKEYVQSKSAPKVEGSGTPGVIQADTSKMSWTELRAHTLARLQAANTST